MKNLCQFACFGLAVLLFSCAAGPQTRETGPQTQTTHTPQSTQTANTAAAVERPAAPGQPAATEQPAAAPPERPAVPSIPEYIMGNGIIAANDMVAFLLDSNPGAEKDFVTNLALIYMEEAAIEGVNHDTAFAQMCLETGFLRYGNLVTADMNNFCGLGAIGPGQTGERFPDPRTGVRAHIQHLKAYATDEPLKQELVDPRYRYVRYGSSPSIKGLSGTWAADRSYDVKISNILERLYKFVFENKGE